LEQGLEALRSAIRKLLRKRGLAPDPGEEALLAGCTELAMLERWFDQALTAASASEALR
jgi:hypothetical protein